MATGLELSIGTWWWRLQVPFPSAAGHPLVSKRSLSWFLRVRVCFPHPLEGMQAKDYEMGPLPSWEWMAACIYTHPWVPLGIMPSHLRWKMLRIPISPYCLFLPCLISLLCQCQPLLPSSSVNLLLKPCLGAWFWKNSAQYSIKAFRSLDNLFNMHVLMSCTCQLFGL